MCPTDGGRDSIPEFAVGDDTHDALFEVLSHPYRRFSLQYLRTTDTSVTVGELATELEAWEGQRPADERANADREAINVSLIHSHLPKMADVGVIEYDAARQRVSLTNQSDGVASQLDAISVE